MLKRNALQLIAISALSISATAVLTACSESAVEFRGVNITGADYARDFSLTDHNGQRRSIKDFQGKVVIVFFGFTQCPDVCPTSMQELAQVKQELGADGDRLQGIFISVDPSATRWRCSKPIWPTLTPVFWRCARHPKNCPR